MDKRYVPCLLSTHLNLRNEDIPPPCRHHRHGDNMAAHKDTPHRYSRLISSSRTPSALKDYSLGNSLTEKKGIHIQLHKNSFHIDVHSSYIIIVLF